MQWKRIKCDKSKKESPQEKTQDQRQREKTSKRRIARRPIICKDKQGQSIWLRLWWRFQAKVEKISNEKNIWWRSEISVIRWVIESSKKTWEATIKNPKFKEIRYLKIEIREKNKRYWRDLRYWKCSWW